MPAIQGNNLSKRWYECDEFGRCRDEAWPTWGRWVALVVIASTLFLLFLSCSLISARRRKRRGLRPFYGTAWAVSNNTGAGTQNPPFRYDHNAEYDNNAAPAPPYSPPPAGYFSPPPGPPPQHYQMGGLEQSQDANGPYNSNPYNQTTGTTSPYYPPPNSPPPAQAYYPPPSAPPPAHTNPDKF